MLSHLWLSGGTRSPLCTALAGLMSSPHLHEVGEIKHQERAFVVAGRGSLRLEHASLWLLPSLQIPTAPFWPLPCTWASLIIITGLTSLQ